MAEVVSSLCHEESLCLPHTTSRCLLSELYDIFCGSCNGISTLSEHIDLIGLGSDSE
jgi:hypothetical protein